MMRDLKMNWIKTSEKLPDHDQLDEIIVEGTEAELRRKND